MTERGGPPRGTGPGAAGLAGDRISLVGWSPWPAERLLAAIDAGTAVTELPGDFTVARDRDGETLIATSIVACRPYYWTQTRDGRLIHGDDVFDIATRAGLPWRWDDGAVRTLALLRHLVGEQTLHRDIRRVPASTVLRHRGGRTVIDTRDPLGAALDGPPRTDGEAVEAMLTVMSEMPEDALLTLTGGKDSRVLLAALMHLARRPATWTAGPPQGTDRRVATAMANDLGLEHRNVELDLEDYLRFAPTITRRTGGAYLAGDWHSYLLLRGAAGLGRPLALKGANGEFVRSFFADYGPVSRALARTPGACARARFAVTVRHGRARHHGGLAFLDPSRGGDDAPWLTGRMTAAGAGPRRALDRLDRFYILERTRRFVGLGVHLADASIPVASPFLDARWVTVAAGLPRARKVGDAWHRAAIARLAPELLRYPSGGEAFMSADPPGLRSLRRLPPDMSYSPFEAVMPRPTTAELIVDSPVLDRFATREERERAFATQHRWTIELLLTLHFAGEAAAEVDRGSAGGGTA